MVSSAPPGTVRAPVDSAQGCLFPVNIRLLVTDAQKVKQALQVDDFHPCSSLQARTIFAGKAEERKEKTKRAGAGRREEDLHRTPVLTNLCVFSLYQTVFSKQIAVYHLLTSFCFGIFQILLKKKGSFHHSTCQTTCSFLKPASELFSHFKYQL